MRSGPGEARTILLLHIISARPSKQPLMVRTFLKVYVELRSYFVSARTNKKNRIFFRYPFLKKKSYPALSWKFGHLHGPFFLVAAEHVIKE